MFKKSLVFIFLINSINAFAHCPSTFKPEKVCLMLDQNIIYIYDEKKEHNGPYQDFKNSNITAVKSEGISLGVARVARGVYRINYAKPLKKIDVEILNDKKKVNLNIEVQ